MSLEQYVGIFECVVTIGLGVLAWNSHVVFSSHRHFKICFCVGVLIASILVITFAQTYWASTVAYIVALGGWFKFMFDNWDFPISHRTVKEFKAWLKSF